MQQFTPTYLPHTKTGTSSEAFKSVKIFIWVYVSNSHTMLECFGMKLYILSRKRWFLFGWTASVTIKNQFQVRVVGVAVDHVCIRSWSMCVCVCVAYGVCVCGGGGACVCAQGEEAASQGHFQISLVGLSCGREASWLTRRLFFLDMSSYKGHLSPLKNLTPQNVLSQ